MFTYCHLLSLLLQKKNVWVLQYTSFFRSVHFCRLIIPYPCTIFVSLHQTLENQSVFSEDGQHNHFLHMPKVITLCECAFPSSNVISLCSNMWALFINAHLKWQMYSLYYCVISVRSISDVYFLMFCNWWLLLFIAVWHYEWRV